MSRASLLPTHAYCPVDVGTRAALAGKGMGVDCDLTSSLGLALTVGNRRNSEGARQDPRVPHLTFQ